jgi:antibiotic biosynthesis monooxygenase (ABM) superfamily enzyme
LTEPAPSDRDEIKLDTPVTTVIRQNPRPAEIARYEEWVKKIVPVAQACADHRGVNIIRPHKTGQAYTIVLHFDTVANLRRWLDSTERQALVEEIRPFLHAEEDIDIKTGLEFWFTPPPAARPARPDPQIHVTQSVIFPLTIVVPWLLQPLFGWVPFLGTPGIRHLVIAAVIVGLVVYVIMPRYTRLVSRWLFR